MKQLMIVLFGCIFSTSILYATDFKIYLGDNFIKEDGIYEFTLNVKAGDDKTFKVDVENGVARTIGSDAKIKNNVITVKAGATKLKEARDLKIRGLYGFFRDRTASLGEYKDTKTFYVDIRQGLTFNFKETDKKTEQTDTP